MEKTEKVKRGIAQYLETEMIGKMTGWQKVLAGTVIGVAMTKADNLINHPLIQTLGICDGDMIDVDILVEHLRNNVPPEGTEVRLPGIGCVRFRKNDVDVLAEYIRMC